MGKKCDLCEGVARMHCESDQASLCWTCDAKVHGANFLVAKHTRCLLCNVCQSPTPWKATGLRLGPTFSVCESCVALKSGGGGGGGGVGAVRSQEVNEDRVRLRDEEGDSAESYDDGEDEDEDEEYSDEGEEEEEEDEAENQVVPWAAPMMSSSSSNGGGGDLAAKRTRESSDEEEMGCFSGQESNLSRPLKRPSRDDEPVFRLEGDRTLSGAVDSIFAISKTRTNLSR